MVESLCPLLYNEVFVCLPTETKWTPLSSSTLTDGKVRGSGVPGNAGISMTPFRKLSRKSDPESKQHLKKSVWVWEWIQLKPLGDPISLAKCGNLLMMPEDKSSPSTLTSSEGGFCCCWYWDWTQHAGPALSMSSTTGPDPQLRFVFFW